MALFVLLIQGCVLFLVLPLGDENNWDSLDGKYPLSNACGQLGQSYEDNHCSEDEKHMECPVDPNMFIVGVTNAKVRHLCNVTPLYYLESADFIDYYTSFRIVS